MLLFTTTAALLQLAAFRALRRAGYRLAGSSLVGQAVA